MINLACEAVAERNPQAYILYCPPRTGASRYHGPSSVEMRETLSKVPDNVWPLWTGMTVPIEKPLKVRQVEEWTHVAGRRPFLWVNHVSVQCAPGVRRRVAEVPGALVFRGDLLPKELYRLFEGVHLNTGTLSDTEAIAYMATAADFVWNPRGWEPVELPGAHSGLSRLCRLVEK